MSERSAGSSAYVASSVSDGEAAADRLVGERSVGGDVARRRVGARARLFATAVAFVFAVFFLEVAVGAAVFLEVAVGAAVFLEVAVGAAVFLEVAVGAAVFLEVAVAAFLEIAVEAGFFLEVAVDAAFFVAVFFLEAAVDAAFFFDAVFFLDVVVDSAAFFFAVAAARFDAAVFASARAPSFTAGFFDAPRPAMRQT
ncbi:MAG: hypothetical protein KF764_01065 [Labilithrix sp.]|nr:hypothetical protein [Labilithrix sp.]